MYCGIEAAGKRSRQDLEMTTRWQTGHAAVPVPRDARG